MPEDLVLIERARTALAASSAAIKGKIILRLLVGLPAVFFVPVITGALLWFVLFQFGRWWPWSACYWGTFALFVPLLFWTEWRTGGNYLWGAVDSATQDRQPISDGALATAFFLPMDMRALVIFADNPRLAVSGFVEVFLFGPRRILGALRRYRQWTSTRNADLTRSAELVVALARADRGVPIVDLLRVGDIVPDIVRDLQFLLVHDVVGLSARGDTVWLLSDARRRIFGAR